MGGKTGIEDLPPPPRERLRTRVYRWRVSQKRHNGLRYWLIATGTPLLLGFTVIYVVSGLLLGWAETYNVLLAITSPADAPFPVLAWIVSIIGWLAAPAITGAVAGYIVSAQIANRRTRPISELYPEGEGQ